MRARALLLVGVAMLALTGCGNDPAKPGEANGTFRTAVVNVDGRDIPCVTWKNGYAGGMSCDWSRP